MTHMRSSQETEPSIAAVCGSIDENATRFASCTRLQSHGMEIIQVLLGGPYISSLLVLRECCTFLLIS